MGVNAQVLMYPQQKSFLNLVISYSKPISPSVHACTKCPRLCYNLTITATINVSFLKIENRSFLSERVKRLGNQVNPIAYLQNFKYSSWIEMQTNLDWDWALHLFSYLQLYCLFKSHRKSSETRCLIIPSSWHQAWQWGSPKKFIQGLDEVNNLLLDIDHGTCNLSILLNFVGMAAKKYSVLIVLMQL